MQLSNDFIRRQMADSAAIFKRGLKLVENGAFVCKTFDPDSGRFSYLVDGNYGDYTVDIELGDTGVLSGCDCPYPGDGCKHKVAVLLDLKEKLKNRGNLRLVSNKADKKSPEAAPSAGDLETHLSPSAEPPPESYLTMEEIKAQALEDRAIRAKKEVFELERDDLYKGDHRITTENGKTYTVTLHDPVQGEGHCSCPDFLSNRLNTCKHLLYVTAKLKKEKGFKKQVEREVFPFVDIYWDSQQEMPRIYSEKTNKALKEVREGLSRLFDKEGFFKGRDLSRLLPNLHQLADNRQVRIREEVYRQLENFLHLSQLKELEQEGFPEIEGLKVEPYPYQWDGIRFGMFRKAVLIGDEMGLGKTLQAIVLSIGKKKIFDFERVLVVTMASLKEQWKREIEKFSDEKATVIAGSVKQRKEGYRVDDTLFKITNYEAVLRDGAILQEFEPDIVILDEAQRIKNFNTKTADAVKSIPRNHAIVLTGTPLENKLEDVYSIVQFLDPDLLSPLWHFAGEHFMLSREKKGQILGYRNLNALHEKLKSLVIRRKKEEVLSDLPDEVVNNFFVSLAEEQLMMHQRFSQQLRRILYKKYLTPMDMRRIQELLLLMRMVADSTYLIDKETNQSPKLAELETILEELVIENKRKVVIFSEWTTMTYLIASKLSAANIYFVELSGKIPVKKRQALIDEFTNNPECNVFLSTDAGGTGLNLQAADCVINFELPWNPSRLNQRIGRVNRIGQSSQCINVINLIAQNSIESRIMAGLQLKTELFQGVFDGTTDLVEFSREKRAELLNQLKEMLEEPPESKPADAAAEIPEDDPYYLNPDVLGKKRETIDYDSEEIPARETVAESHSADQESPEHPEEEISVFAEQPVERVETVLNKGMEFIGGLLEMATGQSISRTEETDKMITIDKTTGEVTMKFKLPGF